MIESLITNCVDAELSVSSNQVEGKSGLEERRHTGSFYTPADAARTLWINIFHSHGVNRNRKELLKWIKETHFIEPASGTGVFVFTLLQLLVEEGVTHNEVISLLRFTAIDINTDACKFFEDSVSQLYPLKGNKRCNRSGITIINQDGIAFLKDIVYNKNRFSRKMIIVGNPPYVKINKTHDLQYADPGFKVADLYALFLYWGSKAAKHLGGGLGFIVPLSVAFSGHHTELRKAIFALQPALFLSHYDNIPDAIFSAGKPDSKNTNKSNSQRVTYFCCNFAIENELMIRSSGLISWAKADRLKVLSKIPKTYKIMPWGNNCIIPKPSTLKDKRLLSEAKKEFSIRDFVTKSGKHSVWVSSTARNYLSVGLDKFKETGVIELNLASVKHARLVFLLLASRAFLDHWKCVGDGFHVTSSNILDFPIPNNWISHQDKFEQLAADCWKKRNKYRKQKQNAGHIVNSYDFTTCDEVIRADSVFNNLLDTKHQVS